MYYSRAQPQRDAPAPRRALAGTPSQRRRPTPTPHIARALGNAGVERLLRPPAADQATGTGTRLTVSRPDDARERMAAAMADRIARMPPTSTDGWRSPPPSGGALPVVVQKHFESLLDADLSLVRVHHDAAAARFADRLVADAVTHRSSIYFASGRYAPATYTGRRLLAHELVHASQRHPADVFLRAPGTETPPREQVAINEGMESDAGAESTITSERTQEAQRLQDEPAVRNAHTQTELEKARLVFEGAVDIWQDIYDAQIQAIESIKTEAEKSVPEPSLPAHILAGLVATLVEVALLKGFGKIFRPLGGAIESWVTIIFSASALKTGARRFRDAAGRFITNESGLKLAAQASRRAVESATSFVDDALKTGFKSYAKKSVIHLLSDKEKDVLPAFFEGQEEAALEIKERCRGEFRNRGVDVLKGYNPLQTAQVAYRAMKETSDHAKDVQELETLRAWLIYVANMNFGLVKWGSGAGTTSLAGETSPSLLGSYQAGVLYVATSGIKIDTAHLEGSTRTMVTLLQDKPIKELGIPVIIDFDWSGVPHFYLNVNENGVLWLVPRNGGAGNSYLRMLGGAKRTQELMSEPDYQAGVPLPGATQWVGGEEWVGGDPIVGALYLWNNIIGPQRVKGILKPDN